MTLPPCSRDSTPILLPEEARPTPICRPQALHVHMYTGVPPLKREACAPDANGQLVLNIRCSVPPNTRRFLHPNPSIHPSIHFWVFSRTIRYHLRQFDTRQDHLKPSETRTDQDRSGYTWTDLHKPA